MTRAHFRYASVGKAIHLNCPYKRVNSWQLIETNYILALCENEKPSINKDLNIAYKLSISSDCTILTISNFSKEDIGTYACFFAQEGMFKKDAFFKHAIQVKLQSKYQPRWVHYVWTHLGFKIFYVCSQLLITFVRSF